MIDYQWSNVHILKRSDRFEIHQSGKRPVACLGLITAIQEANVLNSNFNLILGGKDFVSPTVVKEGKKAALLKTGTGLNSSYHVV